ncbi:peroxiredoxin [Ectothiorhodospira variabilis]|uniref:peroxiredoxin n=1 Tax=Ectothiorhodospira variabilis TaxID=505694 RepID=UPI001EFA45C5|nr:peroxiredoxin [Ectothiorhodospira variabilis]MCG5495808.1 peroxiredoxin [Ectothiorhodospira variabilis]MCG5498721.1 peroxiredoxin [Ectothiorhodospira variabilis]MCG5504758.1 peroxiredoxin [Ectothiorhodospira variabilis]MCG5507915.1 peroxiredoxin [Ectothiorhodospira variabilis]
MSQPTPQVAVDQPVPDFELPATGHDQPVRLSDLLSDRHLVLYFYPRDDTPGCTTEGKDFTEQYARLEQAGARVLGISRDSLKSHDKFKCKYGFPFELLSDEDERVCELFGVMKLKNMYGKQVRGIERSTFLIDRQGVLRQEWRKVKVPGHVNAVIEALESLDR